MNHHADAQNTHRNICKPVQLGVCRKAMGGEFEITFDRQQFPNGVEIAMLALDEIDRIEAKFSPFRSDSLLSYVNHVAPYDTVTVDEEFAELLQFSMSLYTEVDGVLDITSAPLWKLWGFARRQGRIPSEAEIQETLQYVGVPWLEWNGATRQLRFRHPKVEFHFGSIGKGYAVDRAAAILRDGGVSQFVIHGDHSSVFASGIEQKIGVAHPQKWGTTLTEIPLCDAGIGTSGSQQQFFRYRGKKYSHILDPRTGVPVSGTQLVTVRAPSAMLADALSTAFFVGSVPQIQSYCQTHPEITVWRVPECGNNSPLLECFPLIHRFSNDVQYNM